MPVAISQDELDRRKQEEDSKEPDTPVVEVDSRPVAKRILVRGSDGRLHVQFVDVRTGKRIPDTKISKYRFTSANESKWTPTKNTGTDTDTKGTKSDEPQTKTIRLVDGRTKEVPLDWDGPGYTSNKNSVNKENNYTPQGLSKSRETSNTSRSADMNSGADTNTTSAGKDADNSDIGDNGEDISFAKPTNDNFAVKDQNNVTGTNPAALHDAYYDLPTDSYVDGNNFHPMQGQDLSTVGITNRNYTPAEEKAIKETLAGEISFKDTDLSTPEGYKEAQAIMSTIENRAANNKKGVIGAVFAPSQYSTWNTAKDSQNARNNYKVHKAAVDAAYKKYVEDPTSRLPVTSYYNPEIADPAWADKMTGVFQVGPHTFGALPEYGIPKGTPLSPEEQDQTARDIVNQNFEQSFAYPASEDISASPPTTGFYGTDMATGINAQRDYTPDTSLAAGMNAQRDFTPDSSMAAGMNAQRDYTGDGTGFTTAEVDKSSRFNPADVSAARMPGYNESNETSFAAGMNAQRNTIDSGIVDGLNDIGVTDKTTRDGFTAGDIQKSSRFSTPSIAPEDMDRFNAPSVNDQANATNFDQGMQAQRDYTNTGFGDYVKEDQSVTAPSTFGVTPTSSINNTVDSSWTNSASTDISSSPPSFAGIQNEADAAKDTGMNSETNSHTTDGVSDTGPSRDGEGFSGEPGGEAPGTTPGGTSPNEGSDGFSTNTNTGESKPDTGITTSTDTGTDSESNGGSGGGFTSGDDGIGGWDGYI